MRTLTLSVVAAVVVLSLPAHAQYNIGGTYYGANGFGFNNPMSASLSTMMSSNMMARSTYRRILERHGYTDAQISKMSSDEMLAAIKGGASAKAAPAPASRPELKTPASHFRPAKKHLLFAQLAASLTRDRAQQKALQEVFEQGLAAYEKEAAADNLVNDIAGASAFFIGTAYFVAHDGQEPDEEGLTIAARQMQVMFETPQMRKISDTEKQKFYELMIGLGTFLGTTYTLAVQQNDAELVAQMKEVANASLKGYLKVDPAKLTIGPNGLEIAK